MKLSFKIHWPPGCPQRLDDRDFFLHQRVTFFLGVAHALAFDFALVWPAIRLMGCAADIRSKVEIILARQHRIDVAGPPECTA